MRIWAAGAVLTAFLAGTGVAASPVELPPGAELVYSADRAGAQTGRLHLLSSAGERLLTQVGPGNVHAPSWSPVRRELAFSSSTELASPRAALWLYDVERRSTRLLARVDADFIVWSPRGDRLAVAWGSSVTIVHRADGRLQRVPLPSGIQLNGVAWAPEGRRLLVAGNWSDGSWLLVAEPQRRWRRIGPRATADFRHRVAAWSPDGRSIAFATYNDEAERVHTLDVRTGRVRRLPDALAPTWEPDSFTWAPDSRRLAVWDGRRVTIHDTRAGTRRTYRTPVDVTDLFWAADGRSLVLLGGSRLYEVDLARATTRPLAGSRRLLFGWPSTVSPRADAVAVVRGDSGAGSLDLVSPSGRRTRVAGPSDERSPRWLDRWRLVFERAGTIVLLDLRTGQEQSLGAGRAPRPSPDSNAILVHREGDLVVLPLDGGAVRIIGNGGGGTWSPDGRRVAFVRGGDELRVWSRDGEPERLLASAGGDAPCRWLRGPEWSPDGAAIAFDFYDFDGYGYWLCGPQVLAVPATGGALRSIASAAEEPKWSPDGTRLLVDIASGGVSDGVAVIAPDGRRLASWPGRDGVWSPDGAWIAYHALYSGDLWVRRADGTQTRRVAPSDADGYGNGLASPAWRPAGP